MVLRVLSAETAFADLGIKSIFFLSLEKRGPCRISRSMCALLACFELDFLLDKVPGR